MTLQEENEKLRELLREAVIYLKKWNRAFGHQYGCEEEDTLIESIDSFLSQQTEQQPAPEGHEWVLLPIASGDQTEVKADNLKQALMLLDFGLAFALCNTDHGGTRRDVKKAQQHLEEVKAFLAATLQPEQSGLVEALSEAVEALQEAGDFRAAGKGEKALSSYHAALSAQEK